MSLATRLSAFFLVALALVLVGFSGTLYVLSRTYLTRQLDERLELALDTLEASVDIEPRGLEWEPTDRQISLGVDRGISAVRWAVRDVQGAMVDRSANAGGSGFPAEWAPEGWPDRPVDGSSYGDVPGWRLASRRLRLEELLRQVPGHPDDRPGYETQYKVLVLVVGLAPAPVEATLARLGLTLLLLSGAIWGSAALAGRWLCVRALTPVRRMARAAGGISAVDRGWRLPAPGTNDELEELGRAFNGLLDRLHKAFDRLHEAYERQRGFAGDASHQLRTPLTALLGQVQVALRRERGPEEYRRILGVVQAEGERLRLIVESLLFLAQPEDARETTVNVDFRMWLPDQHDRWSRGARGADVRLEVEQGQPLAVLGNPSLFAQMLDNLIENASKYSDPGTPISVRARSDAEWVVLEVEDRGQGLAAVDLERVFEPFFRTDQARQEGHAGVGLGLALAQRVAATYGGTIGVRSEVGAGSLFTVRLPAALTDGKAASAGLLGEIAIPRL